MSEDFSNNQNAKFCNVKNIGYLRQTNTIFEETEENHYPFNRLYVCDVVNSTTKTSNHKLSYQTAESEVRFLKEWLLFHLDLIQQQNEEILSKEKTILLLQQENEMLKERITCMEQGQLDRAKDFLTNTEASDYKDITVEDMTQGLVSCNDNKGGIEFKVNLKDVDSSVIATVEEIVNNNLSSELRTEFCANKSNENFEKQVEHIKFTSQISSDVKIESEPVNNLYSSEIYNFSSEIDSMRHLKMSIRRKRICSNSSVTSQNGCATEERKSFKRIRKSRKKSLKDNQIITTPNFYVNQIGDSIAGISGDEPEISEVKSINFLEVPRWRVKVYASCYTMEGTENLDDEVYLRRHNKLEIDERRRKRWDVQRIREQRVIEKLKQRQERIDSNSRTGSCNDHLHELWPSLDEIKFIEVCDELPVSAFGVPIPKITPSEFSLPWLNNPSCPLKKDKQPIGKGRGRRKSKR